MTSKRQGKIAVHASLLQIFCCFSAEWCSFTIYIMNTLFLQIIKEMLPISSQNYIFTHCDLLLINMWDCCNWTKHHKSSLFPCTYSLCYSSPYVFSSGERCQGNSLNKRTRQYCLLSHTWSLITWTDSLVLISEVAVDHFVLCFMSSKMEIALFLPYLNPPIHSFKETI